jgi:hypothetical protein
MRFTVVGLDELDTATVQEQPESSQAPLFMPSQQSDALMPTPGAML